MYVGISRSLEASIRANIQRMQAAEQALYGSEPDATVTGDEDWFKELTWGSALPLKDQIPTSWKNMVGQVRFNFAVPDQTDIAIDVELPKQAECPPDVPRHRATFRLHWDGSNIDIRAAFQAPINWYLDQRGCEKKWQKVRHDVITFLGRCKSMNEAVKLWPDIRAYVPSEILAKLDTKKAAGEKRDTASILDGIDVDALTTAAVVAKLAENVTT